jgi:hypothetical protein
MPCTALIPTLPPAAAPVTALGGKALAFLAPSVLFAPIGVGLCTGLLRSPGQESHVLLPLCGERNPPRPCTRWDEDQYQASTHQLAQTRGHGGLVRGNSLHDILIRHARGRLSRLTTVANGR